MPSSADNSPLRVGKEALLLPGETTNDEGLVSAMDFDVDFTEGEDNVDPAKVVEMVRTTRTPPRSTPSPPRPLPNRTPCVSRV